MVIDLAGDWGTGDPIWRGPRRQRRRLEAFFNGLDHFQGCNSNLPVQPRHVLNSRSTPRPPSMDRRLGGVDACGANGAPLSGRQTVRCWDRPARSENSHRP